MITLSMTYKEMYDNLASDKHKVDICKNKLLPKAIRAFKEDMKFPRIKCYEYTIPSTSNHYIIFFYAENRTMADNPIIGDFFYIFDNSQRFVVRWVASPYKHTETSEIVLLRQLQVFTYHFFQRYNERFLKKDSLSSNEIAATFLARNMIFTPIEVNEEINRNTATHGENNYAFKIRDGFCFTKSAMQGEFDEYRMRENDIVDAACFVYTTFLSSSEMSDLQKDAIKKQSTEAWKRLYDDFAQGNITLTLNR